jgi:hypothetical protein
VAVLLGDTSALAAKVSALVTMVTQAPLTGITAIDLRVPDRPAVTSAHP